MNVKGGETEDSFFTKTASGDRIRLDNHLKKERQMSAWSPPPKEEVEGPTWDDVYAKVSEALELAVALQDGDEDDPKNTGVRSHLAKAMVLISAKERER